MGARWAWPSTGSRWRCRHAPGPADLLRELWAAPYLPLGVLLLAAAALLLRLPPLWAGGMPLLALLVRRQPTAPTTTRGCCWRGM